MGLDFFQGTLHEVDHDLFLPWGVNNNNRRRTCLQDSGIDLYLCLLALSEPSLQKPPLLMCTSIIILLPVREKYFVDFRIKNYS